MYKQLTSAQRYTISVLLKLNLTQKKISEQIGVNPSTISRELKRNRTKTGHYNALRAQEFASIRKERLPGNRAVRPYVKNIVIELLINEDWSPKQISGYLKKEKGINISHECIYSIIKMDKAAGGELYTHCRHKLKYRHHVMRPQRKTKVKNIPNRISIHDRPVEANGKRFGDWEMDLILGKGQHSAILTLCERSTNMLMMAKLKNGKKPKDVARTVVDLLIPYKGHSLKTITTDNGSEFRDHEYITKRLGAKVYFADSYSSWQKGAIENTNKLIRQYIPKGADFNDFSDDYIKQVQYKINRRPREKLNFDSPKNIFYRKIALAF